MSNKKTIRKIYRTADLKKRLVKCLDMPELRGVLDTIKQDQTSTAPPYDAHLGRTSIDTIKSFINHLRSLISDKIITKINSRNKNLIITLLFFQILTPIYFFSNKMDLNVYAAEPPKTSPSR
jgi:signal recognition particle GTPase